MHNNTVEFKLTKSGSLDGRKVGVRQFGGGKLPGLEAITRGGKGQSGEIGQGEARFLRRKLK